MKKIIIIFTVSIILMLGVLGSLGSRVIYHGDRQEMNTVYDIAGSVVSQYPETEKAVIDSVMTPDSESWEKGKAIMKPYGYDENKAMSAKSRTLMIAYIAILVLLAATIVIYALASWNILHKRNAKQDSEMLQILDKCLSEDYSFISNDKAMQNFDDPRFTDLLTKTAEKLKLKTDYLNEERDNTKTLVTDISHQLKTPISAMKACFDMYVEADSQKEKEEFLSRSRIQMEKLESLAASLVNISRLESNMIDLKRQQVLLTELLVSAVNAVYHKAFAQNIEIITEEFEDIELCMDKKWTAEAIANILDNAVKYSPQSSSINIRIQKMFSFVRVEIEDQGIGIPEAERNRIFKRFFRGANNIVQKEEGSGVGLYLSRKILENQGGTISVKSRSLDQQGSIFVLQLPL